MNDLGCGVILITIPHFLSSNLPWLTKVVTNLIYLYLTSSSLSAAIVTAFLLLSFSLLAGIDSSAE